MAAKYEKEKEKEEKKERERSLIVIQRKVPPSWCLGKEWSGRVATVGWPRPRPPFLPLGRGVPGATWLEVVG